MIIVGSDDHNYSIVIDLLQAKMLVGLLKQIMASPESKTLYIGASEEVNKDGFETLGTDVMASAMSIVSTLGFYTKPLHRSTPQAQAPEPEKEATPESAAVPSVDGEEQKAPPKPVIN